jgi:hypothetical protein
VILVGDCAWILALEDLLDALFHHLEGLPVAARGHRIVLLAIRSARIRIPGATTHALNECRRDPIAFDRQGVTGVMLCPF